MISVHSCTYLYLRYNFKNRTSNFLDNGAMSLKHHFLIVILFLFLPNKENIGLFRVSPKFSVNLLHYTEANQEVYAVLTSVCKSLLSKVRRL